MQRTPLVAANWKMHDPPANFAADDAPYRSRNGVDVAVFPTHLDLSLCISANLTVGAQCGRADTQGAFTGDVSMAMLAQIGCTYVLCGHSERRQHHGESDEDVALQAKAAIDTGLIPIICVGETKEERSAGAATDIIQRQIASALSLIPNPQSPIPVIAYEPVWAIGTGKTATPDDAETMHAFIRSLLEARSSKLEAIRLLYGGSVKPDSAADLIKQENIDGFLVGGASLDPPSFHAIVQSCAI